MIFANHFGKILITTVLACSIFGLSNCDFTYPTVERDDKVEETLPGNTLLKDPYRWLERPNDERTVAFVKNQNAVTNQFVRNNTKWNSVKSSFGLLYNYTQYGLPSKQGDKYYLSINTGLNNQAIIYSLNNLDDSGTVFIDPNEFSLDGTTSLVFTSFSPDGKYCAYGTSVSGSDWIGIYVKKVDGGEILDEKLTKIKFAYVGWNKNSKGFFYAYFDKYNGTGEGTDPGVPEFQALYYHNLNTPQSRDIRITGFADHPKWLIGTPVISEDGKQVHIFPTEGTSNTPWFYATFDPERIRGELVFKPIVSEPNAEYFYVASDDNCTYVRTNFNAKNFRLICVDLNNPASDNWRDIIPENEKWVLSNSLVVNTDYLVTVYMIDVVNAIQVFKLQNGQFLFDVDTPIGTISSLGGKPKGNEFFYKFTTFLSPGIIYRYDFSVKPNKIKVFKESTVQGIRTEDFETNQIFYPSKDGTKVPMFLLHRKNLVKNGKNPTMLYAYGGFNINIQPEYNALGMFFAKNFEGVYAVANIRGGGEYGDDWHKGGMLLNKQNVFDDFAYAGLWLTQNGYTSRDYLTINGRSNGGLLVGASSNQFPHIFGASLANVGVMDMIRFPLFTVGYAWVEEYGDPQHNETMFNYIRNYSPLHSINAGLTQYPNMLVLTADHDDRVVPAHSYKFIAELQYKLGKKLTNTPLMIRIDSNSGHGAGKPISKWIEEYTDIVCFLLNTMKYEYHP